MIRLVDRYVKGWITLLAALVGSQAQASILESDWYNNVFADSDVIEIYCRYETDQPPLREAGDGFTIRIDTKNLGLKPKKAILVGISPHVVYGYEKGKYIKYGMSSVKGHLHSFEPEWRLLDLRKGQHFAYGWRNGIPNRAVSQCYLAGDG